MELWDLYNSDGEFQKISIQRGEPIPAGLYHRIVHIWIYNEIQEFLIQKRAPHLSWFPNRWATTTGSVISGEINLKASAYREIEEELGLDTIKIDLKKINELIIGNSIVTIFSGFLPASMLHQVKYNCEVSDVRWMNTVQIDELRLKDQFAVYSDETFNIAYKILHQI